MDFFNVGDVGFYSLGLDSNFCWQKPQKCVIYSLSFFKKRGDMSIKKIVFVRHAQSIGNTMTQDERAACEIPNHAYPLTDIGVQQATITGQHLRAFWPDLCLHSTYLRTRMSTETIVREMNFSDTPILIADSRLDEKWDGIFHELSKSDIERLHPEQIHLRKRSGYYHYRAPGGESCPDVEIRIRSLLYDPALSGKRILIVGHGRWFIILQKILHGLTVEEFLELKSVTQDNCSVTEYLLDQPILATVNSVTPWKGELPEQDTELA